MQRNLYMLIAYDGTDFHGWQRQPGFRTVQGLLEDSMQRVVRHPVDLIASGRTDAGVHAAGQVANFVADTGIACDRLLHAIGSRLSEDVSVITVREVHPNFHATQSAVSKEYCYRIHNSPHRPVEQFSQRYAYHYWRVIDIDRMREAAGHFIGEKDFTAMASTGCVRESMIRTVLRCDVERFGPEVRISVEGTGFLYNQVRNMVGTLLEVGRGRWEPDAIPDILAGKDRSQAGPTVPPHGLCLRWVKYPPNLLVPPAPRQ
ncbi:MAG: tRNA pseudouridine(38-40) synthase TruA [Phycisphaerales bacterium]|nr:MAG: tRNA pseudouridine(38-40) synthase TruA [Phycisphaerales bacterium]